jgi:hypothetical protein
VRTRFKSNHNGSREAGESMNAAGIAKQKFSSLAQVTRATSAAATQRGARGGTGASGLSNGLHSEHNRTSANAHAAAASTQSATSKARIFEVGLILVPFTRETRERRKEAALAKKRVFCGGGCDANLEARSRSRRLGWRVNILQRPVARELAVAVLQSQRFKVGLKSGWWQVLKCMKLSFLACRCLAALCCCTAALQRHWATLPQATASADNQSAGAWLQSAWFRHSPASECLWH